VLVPQLPLTKDLGEFLFEGTPINATLVALSCQKCRDRWGKARAW
jgi:hypothetical protein